MSERAKVAMYIAACGTCGGGWGAVSTSIPQTDLAASLAMWAADGAELHAYADAQRAEYLEAMRQPCSCPTSDVSHEPQEAGDGWPDISCPTCGAPVSFAEEQNTCGECGSEWTRAPVFTLYRCDVTKRGTLMHAGDL